MQFVDEAEVTVKAGNGGNGCISFRREKFIPRGGPNGGDGGKGGDVIVYCVSDCNTLKDFRYLRHYRAQNGEHGKGSNCTGKSGEDVVLRVPLGTQVLTEDGQLLLDLIHDGEKTVLFTGGKGGLGNIHFKSSTNQAPRRATKGELREDTQIILQLKLLSDVGLIGFPNAGKSTFLSVVSNAKPKIADYPFTTLEPKLGVVRLHDDELVMADLPGLIEDASKGKGLGLQFLRHTERCTLLLHLIDATSSDVIETYQTIRQELDNYSNLLHQKQEIVVLNKIDLLSDPKVIREKTTALQTYLTDKTKVFAISNATREGIEPLLEEIFRQYKNVSVTKLV